MNFTILISCMHQKDAEIIKRNNVQSDVVVINQCDENRVEKFNFINKKGKSCNAIFVCTTERGLSKSRNMAIRYAENADICKICDDDEILFDDIEETVLNAYEENSDFGVINFSLVREDCGRTYPKEKQILGIKGILKSHSLQITFNRKKIVDNGIYFDEEMGSGTGNGGGEENKFLMDCRKKKIKMGYVPKNVSTIKPNESQWFSGYNAKYFRNHGWCSRKILGAFLGFIYIFYWTIFRRKVYKKDCSFFTAIGNSLVGFFEKRNSNLRITKR